MQTPQHTIPTTATTSFRQLSKTFILQPTLTDTHLSITLKDLPTSTIYSKTYTESDLQTLTPYPTTLEDIYLSLKLAVNSEEDEYFQDYGYDQVVRDGDFGCYQVGEGGVLTVFKCFIDRKTNKELVWEIVLKLGVERKMTEIQVVKQLVNCQKCEIKQIMTKQNQRLNQKMNSLELKLDIVLKKQQETSRQLSSLKMIMGKQPQLQFQPQSNYSPLIQQKLLSQSTTITNKYPQKISDWDLAIYPSPNNNTGKIFNNSFKCSIGKNGASAFHKQGDGTTPVGTFPLRQIWIRTDKITKEVYDIVMSVGLPVRVITQYDGWCDQSTSPYYNKHVDLRTFDTSISHENLWRKDDLYDCFIVVGYNDAPVVPGRGSAIFIHVASANYGGTAGCVAFAKPDLWKVIGYLRAYSQITVFDEQVQ